MTQNDSHSQFLVLKYTHTGLLEMSMLISRLKPKYIYIYYTITTKSNHTMALYKLVNIIKNLEPNQKDINVPDIALDNQKI
jgi:hypothetical protein